MDERLKLIVTAIEDKKGFDVLVLDLKGKSSIADYFIICTGKSQKNVQGIADEVKVKMEEKEIFKIGIEGYQEASWILLDYDDILVHVFDQSSRELYMLEELYSEAEELYRG